MIVKLNDDNLLLDHCCNYIALRDLFSTLTTLVAYMLVTFVSSKKIRNAFPNLSCFVNINNKRSR